LKYFMSLGSKNIYLTTAFFLWHFKGYPVRRFLFKIILIGLGGMTTPVATVADISCFWIDSGVKHNNLHGEKTMGQVADAIYC
jgi:hypothetical protein